MIGKSQINIRVILGMIIIIIYLSIGEGVYGEKTTYNREDFNSIKSNTDKKEDKLKPKVIRIFEGSLVEDYDTEYPMIIEGENFGKGTDVYFRAGDGKRYWADEVITKVLDNEKEKLIIYPPKGRDKLPVGKYSITIRNKEGDYLDMEYGVLSVVPRGEFTPNSDYLLKYKNLYGKADKIKDISNDIPYLEKTNSVNMTIDLDKKMGENFNTKEIEQDIGSYKTINLLNLRSNYMNLKIRDLRTKSDSFNNTIRLRTGKVGPFVHDMVRGQVVGSSVKSDIIEVKEDNFDFKDLEISIPYRDSWNEEKLKMLRYDELENSFQNITIEIDRINRKIIGRSNRSGIFLIVE